MLLTSMDKKRSEKLSFSSKKTFKNELSPPFDVKRRKRKTEVDIGQRIAELEDDARQEIPYIVINQLTKEE